MSRRMLRGIDGASVVLGLSALLLAFWPVRADDEGDRALPPSLLATGSPRIDGARRAAPRIDSSAAGIVGGNVFSSTRRAPSTRFMPPGADASMPDAVAMPAAIDYAPSLGAASDSAGSGDAGARDPVPSLYGIVGIDGVPHALLALRGGEPPRLFAVGDRHAGYRISAIERDRVILATTRGSRTLRLATPALASPRDSSENLP